MRHTSWDSPFDGNEPGSKEGFVGNETTDSRIERRFEPENDPVDGDPNVPDAGIETPLGRIPRWNREGSRGSGKKGVRIPGGWGPWGPNPTMEKWMEKSTITRLNHVVDEEKRGREERQHDHVRSIVHHETVLDGTGTVAWPGEDDAYESTTTPRG